MMWWAIWCAAVVAGTAAAPAADALGPLALDLPQIDSLTPDDESMSYAGPAGRYAASAPLVYLLPDMPRDAQRAIGSGERRSRPKRKMPSLSINNPMEVLRQRLMLEVARKQMREASQRQAVANRLFLQNVGKRGFWANSGPATYDN